MGMYMNETIRKTSQVFKQRQTQGDDRNGMAAKEEAEEDEWKEKRPTEMKRSTLNLFVAVRVFACVCVNGENVAYENKLKQVIRA